MARVVQRGGVRRPLFGADDRALGIDLVVTGTEDGQSWDGMIFRPGRASPRRRLAVLVIHGSVGNYITGVPRRVSFGLANAGFTVMSVNTRMANYGVIFGGGLMHRTPLDIDAALGVLRRRGFSAHRAAGLQHGRDDGHPLPGAAPAGGRDRRLHPGPPGLAARRAAAALGPLRLRARPTPRSPSAAHLRLAPDYESPERDRIFIVRRARGFGDRPVDGEVWTYRTWWFSRGPRAPHAESRLRIGSVTVPIAIIQAGEDELVRAQRGPPARGARAPGRLPQRGARDDPRRRPRLRRPRRRADRGRRGLAGRAPLRGLRCRRLF